MITVIIPTYNEEKNIENCLQAFQRQTIPRDSFEIIVVDGASKDRTAEIAAKYADRVIEQVSKGVGGARNDGVREAKGTIIATTDADCLPPEQWLEKIQRSFAGGGVVAATGLLNPILTDDMGWAVRDVYRFMFDVSNFCLIVWGVFGYRHLCGANVAFDRAAFLEAGGYSDLPYSDDVEIAGRLNPLGKMVMDRGIWVNYSVRRIRKLGLAKYTLMIVRNDLAILVLNRKPVKDDYAKQDYG